jgi:hypothetical protein
MGINYDLVTTLGTAKGGSGGEYFKAGFNFKVAIEKCEWKTARDGREYVIISTQVLESDCPDQAAGRKPAHMINMNLDTGMGTLADFLRLALTKLAVMSEGEVLDPDDDAYWNEQLSDKALLSAVLEEANVLMGVEMYVYTKPITTRAGKPFTIHEWSLTPTASTITN